MSKLIVYAVAACLVAGLILNILVATSCDIVQGSFETAPGKFIHLGAYKYKVNTTVVGPPTTTAPPQTAPTISPAPSVSPSISPSYAPTEPGATPRPTNVPSTSPSVSPSRSPSASPSKPPSIAPSYSPTQPEETPRPTASPTIATPSPSTTPSSRPSVAPTPLPSRAPTPSPSSSPTEPAATPSPTFSPTEPEATPSPTFSPTTSTPTPAPTQGFIPIVTEAPTFFSTGTPSPTFSSAPTSNFTGNFTTLPFLGLRQPDNTTTTTILSPRNSETLMDVDNGFDFRQRNLQTSSDFTTDTDGSCKAFGEDDTEETSVAQAGVIMAPVCGFVVLVTVLGKKQIPFATPLMWLGYLGCQIGMLLVWSMRRNEFCNDDNECDWSKGAWMNVGAHIIYAIAAFASCKLPDAKKDDSENRDDFNSRQDDRRNDDDQDDEFANAIINAAMLDSPTVYDGHSNRRVNKLEAELEAQKAAAAMEAGKAQAIHEQLEDQQAELVDTREKLWEAQQEAEAERERLAAAAAMADATTTVEALRAQELELRLSQQIAAMDQLEKRIREKEMLLEKEKDKAMETGMAYYPAVWEWLGFGEPGEGKEEEGAESRFVPGPEEVEDESDDEMETGLAYYPSVWKYMGFIDPREYVERPVDLSPAAPRADPEGATVAELRMAREQKLREDEMAALATAAEVQQETKMLKDELEVHKKEIEEIKAAMTTKGGDRQDPPLAGPPVRNPNAADPVGLTESEIAARAAAKREPGADPPQVTRRDPANDPEELRRSAHQQKDTKVAPMFDPPIQRTSANDPEELRRSAHQKEDAKTPPVHDPPIQRIPANDPEELRRSAHHKQDAEASPAHDPPNQRIPANDPDEVRRSAVGASDQGAAEVAPPAETQAVDTANQEREEELSANHCVAEGSSQLDQGSEDIADDNAETTEPEGAEELISAERQLRKSQ